MMAELTTREISFVGKIASGKKLRAQEIGELLQQKWYVDVKMM